jgi:vacuolar-type H+-ATPase subunit E/Vma4
MTAEPATAFDALDDTLRRSVAQHVEATVAGARRDANALLQQAQRDAEELTRRAREEGEAAADAVFARERATSRRDSSTTVLDSKRAALLEVQAGVCDAVLGLRTAPDYARLLDGLAARARAQLGPDAQIVRDPKDVGGVIAEEGVRRVDYTLPALADRALAELGEKLEGMWR